MEHTSDDPRGEGSGPLRAEDVEALPDGTPVMVTWSGGNGPHRYVIAVDKWGRRYAASNTDPDDRMRWYNPLTYVGTARWNTRVWLGGAR